MNNQTKVKHNENIVCLEGNGYRPSHKGDGWIVGEVMYTLNITEVHAVCYVPTLVLNDQGGAQMSITYDVTSTLRSQTKHHEPVVLVYDARGNGNGSISPTLTGDHQDRITDYTAIVVEAHERKEGV